MFASPSDDMVRFRVCERRGGPGLNGLMKRSWGRSARHPFNTEKVQLQERPQALVTFQVKTGQILRAYGCSYFCELVPWHSLPRTNTQ